MKLSKGFYFTFGAATIWAINIIITKFIFLSGENVFNLTFWLLILATPYWIFVFKNNFDEFKKASRNDYLVLLAMGLISTVLLNLVDYFAMRYSQAINYSFLVRTTLLFTIIFAFLFLGEKITFKKVVLTSLILIGVYLLISKGQKIILSKGDFLTLLDAALISFGNTILGKIATNRMSPSLSASGTFLVGVIPIATIGFLNHALGWPKSITLILIAVVFCTLSTIVRFKAYKYATAGYVAMIYSMTPLIVSILAVPLLKESMTPIQFFGGFLMVLSGMLVEKFKI